MKKLCAPLCWLALLCATSVMRGAEAPATLIVEPLGTGEFDFNPQTGVATATNGVVVRSGKATLTASKVTVDQTGGDVLAEGINRMRQGKIEIAAGYDGEFGHIKIFQPGEREQIEQQMALF